MPIVFPDRALPPTGSPPRPLADVAFYFLLRDHPDLAVFGFKVDLAFELYARETPFIRMGVVRHERAAWAWESSPVCSVDVYADEHLEAEAIATTIARVWPHLKKLSIPGEGYVSGGWVEVEPYRINEPDEAGHGDTPARYHLEVGVRLHPPIT